jgi:hypothetical protein
MGQTGAPLGAGTGYVIPVNTLVAAETVGDLPAIYGLLKSYKVTRWSLFFLISVGRGKVLQPLSPQEAEALIGWIFETSLRAPFIIATTEGPSYRKIVLGRMRLEGMTGGEIKQSGVYRSFGIRDGHGIAFVSHTGEICPAGFLPLMAGNVRQDHLVTVYRDSPVFRQLHDPAQFEGHCGTCPTICSAADPVHARLLQPAVLSPRTLFARSSQRLRMERSHNRAPVHDASGIVTSGSGLNHARACSVSGMLLRAEELSQ